MRKAVIVVLAGLAANCAILSAATAAPSAEAVFRQFDLFGRFAAHCDEPATPDNPHVSISAPGNGAVLEEQNVGSDFAINRYRIVTATRLSPTRLAVTAIFQAGAQDPERQRLEYLVAKDTRRTMFNQPEGGEVRVKNGVAISAGLATPILRKCE
jgi:hypothetical protein